MRTASCRCGFHIACAELRLRRLERKRHMRLEATHHYYPQVTSRSAGQVTCTSSVVHLSMRLGCTFSDEAVLVGVESPIS
jgi:hypothetical protein